MAAKKFVAVLEKGDRALGWTVARVPFDPSVWKTMVRLRVKGTVNGFAFRTSLFSDPRGGFYLLVNKAMQKGGGAALGEKAEFALEPDLQERMAELPEELEVLLDEEPGLRDFYDELTEYTRREVGKWIGLAKSDAARRNKAEQMAERLMATMEGEVTLPPVVEREFKKRPKARAGWAKMTPLQRRHELMAVFYYQSPAARQKRVEKLCEGAEKKA